MKKHFVTEKGALSHVGEQVVSPFVRRAIVAGIAGLLALPFLVGLLHERAFLVRHRKESLEAFVPLEENFLFVMVYLYAFFAFFLFIWLAYLFFSGHPWKRSELFIQAQIILVVGGFPALGTIAFFIFTWP